MATSKEIHTPEVLAEVLAGAKHIDLIEVLNQDIAFLKDLNETFGRKPSKEENIVMDKYKTILDNKVEFIGQMLETADMNFSKEKLNFSDFNLIKREYNITVIISDKEGV